MEVLIQSLVGLVLVPLYNLLKKLLGLKDTAAAWVMLILTLMLAFPLALLTGAFVGIEFNVAEPLLFLGSVGRAFLVLLGVAEGLYMINKKRKA